MEKYHFSRYEALRLFAFELRKTQKIAETKFWNIVRRRQILGQRFLRQYVLEYEFGNKKRFCIADFYCSEAALVIEVDGGIHEKQKEYDAARSEMLNQKGISVLRFTNDDLENETFVIEHLTATLRRRLGD